MTFFILNCALALFFCFLTHQIDSGTRTKIDDTNPLIVNTLLMAVVSILFTVLIVVSGSIAIPLFKLFARVVFLLEGCFLVNLCYCLIFYAVKYPSRVVNTIKWLLYIFIVYIVFFQFKDIEVSLKKGVLIQSAYLFDENVRKVLPWTWVTLYVGIFRFVLPAFCCLFMLLWNENRGTRLERHQSYIYAVGIVSMWCFTLFISYISGLYPQYTLLSLFPYAVMLIIMTAAAEQKAAPSGRAVFIYIVKGLVSFIIPALIAGLLYTLLFPLFEEQPVLFGLLLFACTGALLFLAWKLSDLLTNSRKMRTTDYEQVFEKDLASIDYNGEMDEIEQNMFNIFKKNVECSSMSVFIGNQGMLDLAYSSDDKKYPSISQNAPVFDDLLNINKNVVVYTEFDTLHALAPFRSKLELFFHDYNCDALFVLNEGRNVLGLITLGLKTSGDHYKDYDIRVFTKLYSYFFVFGYYMRNISNKEIIGTVNREIRMSSQIITSIQENMDKIKSPKIDAGCIMVPAHNIGGEFIDLIRLTDNRHLFVVGDFSGKGIAASMSMVILKSIIRTFLAQTHDFKELVVRVNEFIRNSLQKGTIFAGMFALVDFETDTMYYINCGIPAIFMYTQSYNNVIEIQGGGHILGFVKDISPYVSVKQIKLNKGDIVLACTDGLITSHSLRGEEYGKERIQQGIIANSMYPAQRMAQFCYDSLMKFMSKEMEDDVSVLVMKYLGSENADVVNEPEQKAEENSAVKSSVEGA